MSYDLLHLRLCAVFKHEASVDVDIRPLLASLFVPGSPIASFESGTLALLTIWKSVV